MAFTKTVNYTQSKPQSLGYSNEVSGTTGTVTATITFNAKGGRLSTGTFGSSTSELSGKTAESLMYDTWEITGTLTDVNSALDALEWIPGVYGDPAIDQTFTDVDRATSEHKGEILVEIEALTSISAGSTFWLSDDGSDARALLYRCTAKEVNGNHTRLYGTLWKDYTVVDGTQTAWDQVESYEWSVWDGRPSDVASSLIGPIIDLAYVNPHGEYVLDITITDDNGVHDTGTTTLIGVFFVPEPQFTVNPPDFISHTNNYSLTGTGDSGWDGPYNFGEIAQTNNELVSVQLLAKRFPDSVFFDGDVSKNKPSYITTEGEVRVGQVRVDNRVSESFATGEVRWQFYGTPAQCNQALSKINLFINISENFLLETRIVNGRARIHNNRGIY